jgi:hypothetical protein
MPSNRFGRSFAVSFGAIVALFAIPVMHCSTTTTPATDTGARALSADGGGSCGSSTNPFAPIICIASDGSATPNSVLAHSKNNMGANPIVFKTANGTGTLAISTTCSQISLGSGCGHGPVCNARTVPEVTGTCTYSASVNGSTPADPIIVTDNCCPSTTETLGRP